MNDEWRTIPGYGGRYMINKSGDVVSVMGKRGTRSCPMRLRRYNDRGTVVVSLLVGGERKQRSVMRLMVTAWIRELGNNEIAYPINGDGTDTRLENIGIRRRGFMAKHPVLKVDSEGNVVARYDSIGEAADAEYVSIACIRYHLYGQAQKPFEGEYRFVREDGVE